MATAPADDPELLGWPPDGPTLRLDYRRFSYAGKFVMSTTGKAVVRLAAGTDGDASDPASKSVDGASGSDDGDASVGGGGSDDDTDEWDDDADGWDDDVLAAVAFNEDRTDGDALWIRYVTVRRDRRGEGLGPELCAFVAERAAARGYERVRIAVNNPFAYEALYRAGFAYTGEETGLAELVLERPADVATMRASAPSTARYREGLEVYAQRELSPEEAAFVARKRGGTPPDPGP